MFGITFTPSLEDNADYLGKDNDAWGYRGMQEIIIIMVKYILW